MNCPKCGTPTVKLAIVQCSTGDAEKRGCSRCRGIWFVQIDFRLFDAPNVEKTHERLARLAAAAG